MAGRNLAEAQREAADQARRETVELLHEQLADGIANLDGKDAWQRWLGMASKLHRYRIGSSGIFEVRECLDQRCWSDCEQKRAKVVALGVVEADPFQMFVDPTGERHNERTGLGEPGSDLGRAPAFPSRSIHAKSRSHHSEDASAGKGTEYGRSLHRSMKRSIVICMTEEISASSCLTASSTHLGPTGPNTLSTRAPGAA
jgi:hypothetical protein